MANRTNRVIAVGVGRKSIVFESLRKAANAFGITESTVRRHIYDKKGRAYRGYAFDYFLEVWDAAGS